MTVLCLVVLGEARRATCRCSAQPWGNKLDLTVNRMAIAMAELATEDPDLEAEEDADFAEPEGRRAELYIYRIQTYCL